MFNSIQNISAYSKIIPSPEVIPLKFQTSLHQNLFILTILYDSKEKSQFNFNTNPFLNLLYKKIDNKVIIIISQDTIKNNPYLFLNFTRELSLISVIRIWGDYKREIFDKENPDALFYKISQQNLPPSNSSIAFSETLYNYLKRLCLFEKVICGESEYYIPQFKNNNKNKYFFGRENELKILNKNYNRIKYEFSGECYNIITVKGVPGIGKTSLVKAFLKERGLPNSFFIANPHTVQPYGYFLEFTNTLLGQTSDFKSAIKSFISSVGDAKLRKNLNDSIPYFPQNFSKESFLKDNEERSQNTILAFRNLIRGYAYICASQKKPLILAFDDIQWADMPSVKTINFILDDFKNNFERSIPLQFIFIYRAGYTIGIKPDIVNSTELELDTLDSATSHNYLLELLRINDLNLSKKIQSSLLVKSGGNPLFLEEIVEHIKYNSNEVPASVKEIIKQRFFSLPEKLANFLKACSVIGKEIDLRTANCLLQRFNSDEISENDLEYLVQNKFLNKTPSLIEFKHDLIKESIYDSLDESEKKTLHDFAGVSIEKIYSEKIENYYYQLAEHFTQADNRDKMIEYLEKAGDGARGYYEYRLAENYYERLFAVIKYSDDWHSFSFYCEALIILGKLDKLKVPQLLRIAKLKSKDQFCFRLLTCAARYYYSKSDYKKSKNLFLRLYREKDGIKELHLLIDVMKGLFDSYIQLNMLNKILTIIKTVECSGSKHYLNQNLINEYKGRIFFKKGQYTKALASYKKVYEIASKLKLKRTEGNMLIKLGGIYFFLEQFSEARGCFQKAVKINNETGNYRNLSICYGNLANVYLSSGSIINAYRNLMIQQKIIKSLGDKFSLALNYNSLGNCHLKKEEYLNAEKYFSQMMKISKELKMKHLLSPAYSNLAIVNMILGNYEKALEYFFVQSSIENGFISAESKIKWNYNLSYIYRRTGKFDMAINHDRAGLLLSEKEDNKLLIVSGLLNMSLNFFKKGNLELAKMHIDKIPQIYILGKINLDDHYYESLFYSEMYDTILNKKHFSKKEILSIVDRMKKNISDIQNCETIYELNYYLVKICKTYEVFSEIKIYRLFSNLLKIYIELYKKTGKYNYKLKIFTIKNLINKHYFYEKLQKNS